MKEGIDKEKPAKSFQSHVKMWQLSVTSLAEKVSFVAESGEGGREGAFYVLQERLVETSDRWSSQQVWW